LRIILAKTAGFCMGVKRAMEKVLAIARDKSGPVFTYGPLIHNRQAVEMLDARGICARTSFEKGAHGTVLLRTHGVPPDVVEELRSAGLDVEDGTCPHVLRGQRSIGRRSADGYEAVIVGDRDHDEVAGLAGHAAGPCRIIASVAEASAVPLGDKVIVVAQTTFNKQLFHEIADVLRERKPDVEIVDSICTATSERQAEARLLASEVDAMVVVGGLHSANTKRLAEVARETNTPTFHIETAADLDLAELARYETVGVTAGASTPSWITSTVIDKLQSVGETRSPLARAWNILTGVIIDGNLYVAAGAAALTYVATRLLRLGLGGNWERACLMAAAFGYIFCVYALGRMAEARAGGSGLTRRAEFYRAHTGWMAAAAVLLSVVSIAALVQFGPLAVALLGVSYAMAVAYSALITPRKQRGTAAVRLVTVLRNIPASKDVLSAAGWTVVAVFVPAVAAGVGSVYAVAVVAALVFGLAFIRSVMFDFTDVMADRLLGRDTLPALIGVAPARAVLAALALLLGAVLAAGSAVIAGPGLWLVLCPAYVLCYLLVFEKWITASERRCTVVVDGVMLVAGLIGVVDAILR